MGVTKDGAALIAEERRRQVEQEGWTLDHDDEHDGGELAVQAARLAINHVHGAALLHPGDRDGAPFPGWQRASRYGDDVRRLVIAGALVAAEIDRLQRQPGQELRRASGALLALVLQIGENEAHCIDCSATLEGAGVERIHDIKCRVGLLARALGSKPSVPSDATGGGRG